MSEFTVKPLDRESIDEQITVYREAFKVQVPFEDTKSTWLVKHYQNPAGNSEIFGAFDGEKLVGINAFMPFVYSFNGKEYRAVQSCISGVLNDYRGKGIWSKIIAFAMDYFKNETDYDFAFGFPNINNSYHGFVKFGWTTVCDMDNYVLINNGAELMRKKIGALAPLAKVAQLQGTRVRISGKLKKGEKAFGVSREEYMKQLGKLPESRRLRILQSDEFMAWKGDYAELSYMAFSRDDEISAICVYAVGNYGGSDIIKLYSVQSINGAPLSKHDLAACVRYLQNKYPSAAFIRTWVKHGEEAAGLYSKLRFMKSKHRNPFIVLPFKDEATEMISDAENWQLSFMDLD